MSTYRGCRFTEAEMRDIYSRIPLREDMSEEEMDSLFGAELRRRGDARADTWAAHGGQTRLSSPQRPRSDSRSVRPGVDGDNSQSQTRPRREHGSNPEDQPFGGKHSSDPYETQATHRLPSKNDDPYFRQDSEKDLSLQQIYLCNKFQHLQEPELTKALREEVHKIKKAGGWLVHRMMMESTAPEFQQRSSVVEAAVEGQRQDPPEVEEYLLNKFGHLLSDPNKYMAATKLERQFIGAAGSFKKYMAGHEQAVKTEAPTVEAQSLGKSRVNPIAAHLDAKFGHLKERDEGAYLDACRGELEQIKAAGGLDAFLANGGG